MTSRPSSLSASRNLALLTAGIVVGVLVCEGLARIAGLAPPVIPLPLDRVDSALRVSSNPVLGWELVPGHRAEHPDFSMSFRFINSAGQRDHERTIAKPPETYRIIVLGDSVAMGLGLREIDHLLGPRLQHATTRADVEVLTFAVVGYNTRAEVELLTTKGLAYDPDLVLLVFSPNDYQPLNDYLPNVRVERPWLAEQLFVRSTLFRTAALRFDWWHFGLTTDQDYSRERQQRALSRRDAEWDGSVERSLATLRTLADEHDFGLAVALWPFFFPGEMVDDTDAPDAPRLAPILSDLGVPLLYVSDVFGCDLAERGHTDDPKALYAPDGQHPTLLGARVAATGMAQFLEEAGAWGTPILRNLHQPPRRRCSAPPARRPS